jgi:hypothetical protein
MLSANSMGLIHKKWVGHFFQASWRLAVLLLPWQTRWFLEGPALGGFPWEGGRVSIYLSWIPLVSTVIFYVLCSRFSQEGWGGRRAWIAVSLFFFFLSAVFSSLYLPATLQWLAEVFLLLAFGAVTLRAIDYPTLCRWIVYAVFPHAVLGLIQFSDQIVFGSKWLGISSQVPLSPGVSVVESMGQRWLRAYGGFPHPNILGGWLVVGVGCLLTRGSEIDSKHLWRRWSVKEGVWDLGLVLFSVCFVLTFSRSAWVALGAFLLAFVWKMARSGCRRACQKAFVAFFLMFTACGATAFVQRALIVTRTFPSARLEVQSLNQRQAGILHGKQLFFVHPWLGVGPRVSAYALVQERHPLDQTIPLLPHNVFLMALDEIGVIGYVLLGCLFWWFFSCLQGVRLSYLLPFFVISSLDHYPWSTWSGMVWTMLIFCLVLAKDSALDTPVSHLAKCEHRD